MLEATPFDSWGGKRPWAKYRSGVHNKQGEEFSVPEGRVCLLCRNLFKMLGMDYTHGSHKRYADKIKSKAVDHQDFLAKLDRWIKTRNSSPGQSRLDLSHKQGVQKAKQQLKSQRSSGVTFEAPDMVSVSQEHWDEKEYGQLDEAKLEEQVFWKDSAGGLRPEWQEGSLYKVNHFQTQSHVQETLEHDGEHSLQRRPWPAKRRPWRPCSTTHKTRGAQAQQLRKDRRLLTWTPSWQLLLAKPAKAAPQEWRTRLARAQQKKLPAALEEAKSEPSSDSDVAVAARLGVGRKAAKGKAKPKASATTQGKAPPAKSSGGGLGKGTPADKGPATTAAGAGSEGKAKPENAKAAKADDDKKANTADAGAGALTHAPVLLDGRGLRLKGTVTKQLDDIRRRLEPPLRFDQDLSDRGQRPREVFDFFEEPLKPAPEED